MQSVLAPPHIDERFVVSEARTEREKEAAYRLRHSVFVAELGGTSTSGDGFETDRFDPFCRQLILTDRDEHDRVIGTYRALDPAGAAAVGGYYSQTEYDLGPILASGRKVLEFGRSCLHPDYRGGPAMAALWTHILDMVRREQVELLFGVASFHGADPEAHRGALSILHHNHLTRAALRPRALAPGRVPMDRVAPENLDRKAAMRDMPALIKAYLRLGATVGEGAFVDRVFNTTDICIVLDMDRLNTRHSRFYERKPA